MLVVVDVVYSFIVLCVFGLILILCSDLVRFIGAIGIVCAAGDSVVPFFLSILRFVWFCFLSKNSSFAFYLVISFIFIKDNLYRLQ